jgi:hypothetical protein
VADEPHGPDGAGPDAPVAPPGDAADPERFSRAIAAIDAANADDPVRLEFEGAAHAKELLHSRLMTAWLTQLDPTAGEAQHLAARAHHFRRWTRPREDYPEGRAGYLRWRAAAKRRHAEEVGELLAAEGYDGALVERVGQIIRKEGLGGDAEVQVHEDALCLVFLQTQLDDLADQVGEDEMVRILERTIPKLSAAGVQAAMTLELGDRGASLLARAAAAGG